MSTIIASPGTTPPAAAAVTPPAAAAPAAPTAAEVAALKVELETSKAQAAEHERNARFWYGKANKAGAPEKPPTAAAAEAEPDILDVITSQGTKGLAGVLKKLGFVSAEEVDAKVNDKATQLTSEAQLLKDYPDLGNEGSAFFKETARYYGQLKAQGVPERIAMGLAAKEAKLAGIEAGTIKTPAQRTADEAATRAADRAARAAAGAGDRGGRGAAEEDDDTPTEDERRAIQRLADALEIPLDKAEERYKARAKKGVNVAVKLNK